MSAVILAANLAGGFSAGLELLPVALRQLRERTLRVCDSLCADDWGRQSRCDAWSVHEVMRHVGDACRIHGAALRREPTPFSSGEPFHTQDTPRQWLERTAGLTPDETVAELRAWRAGESAALDARLADYTDEMAHGPYGPLHWTVLSAHVFWDAWLHARDVTEVLGRADRSTGEEERMAALYGLLIASAPAARMKHPFEVTVALAAADGDEYFASVVAGAVTLSTEVEGAVDFRGQLAPAVDALAGRGRQLEDVLHGERSALEPLTWLRSRLLPAG